MQGIAKYVVLLSEVKRGLGFPAVRESVQSHSQVSSAIEWRSDD